MEEPLQQMSIKTAIGNLVLISDGPTLVGAAFGELAPLQALLSRTLIDRGFRNVKTIESVSDEVERYFDGDLQAIDRIKVRQPGGPFSQKAWVAMRKIKPGKVISYSELAANSGSSAAVRAAGSACARNLIAPIIPCHRIVRSDGTLGGYGFGLPTKIWLLEHEGAL